jgi:hypothetical protein
VAGPPAHRPLAGTLADVAHAILGMGGAALLAAVLGGCSDLHVEPLPTIGSSVSDPEIPNPSFAADIQPVFASRCAVAGCHITPTEANLGLVLKDTATSYNNLVNADSVEVPGAKRVVPADSTASYLMFKLDSGEMPKSGPMLSDGTRNTIRNWIDQGAAYN